MINILNKQSKLNSRKKVIIYILALIITVTVTGGVFIYSMASEVSSETEEIIDEVLAAGLPDLILGDTGMVRSDAMEIWYESILPTEDPKGIILLIMGLGGTALEWPIFFVEPLVDAGYHVIRFDNRGTGLSTWTDRNFKLKDMASDAVAILDELEVGAAHVVGMSMGGMIAQQMAIDYPVRVLTLTSYSSTANVDDSELPNISTRAIVSMTATALRYQLINSERNSIRAVMGIREILANYIPEERKKALIEQTIFNERIRRRGNPNALMQHTKAIFESESRYEELSQIEIPTLVIHGKKDPLIPVDHGIKTASIISDAQLLLLEGLGHDINPDYSEIIHDAIFDLISNAISKE